MRLSRRLFVALISLGAVAVLALLLGYQMQIASRTSNLDIITYLHAAMTVRHGGDPYTPVSSWMTRYGGGPFQANYYVYAPAFALFLIPLTFLPMHLAVMAWAICNMLFLAGAVVCAMRATGRYTPPWMLLALVMAVALLSPVRMEMQWGQADILLTFLISASFLAARSNHPLLGGALLASAAVIKPPLLALLLFFLWKREWRLALSAAAGAVILFLAPFLILGSKPLHEQLAIWSFWSNRYTAFIDNVSPKGVLARLLTANPNGPGLVNSPALVTILWMAVVLLLGVVALAMTSRHAVQSTRLALVEFSLAVCTVLLVSPLTEWIYLTLLAIPLLLCASSILPWYRGPEPSHTGKTDRNGVRSGDPSARQPWVQARPSARLSVALVLVYGALCAPLNHIEYRAWPGIAHGGVHGALWVLVAAIYLYPLLAAYGLSVAVLRMESGRGLLTRLREFSSQTGVWRPVGRLHSTPPS